MIRDVERALVDIEAAAREYAKAASEELQHGRPDVAGTVRAVRMHGQASGLRLALLILRDRCGLPAGAANESAHRDGARLHDAATASSCAGASPEGPPSMTNNDQHPSAARESAPVLATEP